MTETQVCPECGAALPEGGTCETYFHQLLFWEAEFPELGVVHHLMVLCYHLQHPSLYSADGLANATQLLTSFVRDGRSPAEVRHATRDTVNSKNRQWKITARPDSKGTYAHPVIWTMRAADVVPRGADQYVESVGEWAQSVYDVLQASENLA
jgi:hypothetical protein